MPKDKLNINIPLANVQVARRQRARHFFCCSCFGPVESVSDSTIQVTLGKCDDYEYVVEKLAIKRLPKSLFATEDAPTKLSAPCSQTTVLTHDDDQGDGNCFMKEGNMEDITFSSYYKKVPCNIADDTANAFTPGNKYYENATNQIQAKMFPHVNASESECRLKANQVKYVIGPSHIGINHKHKVRAPHTIDPDIQKTLEMLGSACGGDMNRMYGRGPCSTSSFRKQFESPSCKRKSHVPDKSSTDDTGDTKASRAKWKIVIKHHDKNRCKAKCGNGE